MMKNNSMKKVLSFILCIVLIAAMALCVAGCNDTKTYGKGSTEFTFVAVDLEGKEFTATVKTDKGTVGEALVDEGLIEGYESEYGLFVTTVNGITLDWDKDGKYWAFYVDGEYATAGVDTTPVTAGATYKFQPES